MYLSTLRSHIEAMGNDRWYDENAPVADRLYDDHLEILKKEG